MYEFVTTQRGWIVFWGPDPRPRPAKEMDETQTPDGPGGTVLPVREGDRMESGAERA